MTKSDKNGAYFCHSLPYSSVFINFVKLPIVFCQMRPRVSKTTKTTGFSVTYFSSGTRNIYAARYNETNMLRSTRLHSRVSSNSRRTCATSTHRLPSGWEFVQVETSSCGTEGSWPLLQTQHAD